MRGPSMSVTSDGVVDDESAHRLRSNALGLIETIGQSLAAISPTLTPVLNITVAAGLAGIGCWLSYFIGTIGVVIVAASVGTLAARHREAGSYFVYVGRTFGPLAGALAGWAMISAYMFTAIAVSLSFAILLGNLITALGARAGVVPLSAAMLVFFVLVSCAVFSALPFAIFSFVGFESAATLAKETSNPRRDIPIAVMGCAAFAGIFFTVTAYFMVFGMGHDTVAMGKSSSPFGDVASRAGLGSAAIAVYIAAMISVFACALASINAAARLLFSMGKYQFLHGAMGRVHAVHRTPHCAIVLCGVMLAAISITLTPLGLLDAYGCSGTFASFGFVVVYLAICIVAPMDLRRGGEMKLRHVLIGAVGTGLMLFVIFGSVYPVPAYPYNMLPFVFFGYMLLGAVWFAVLKARSPQTLAAIEHDMEG